MPEAAALVAEVLGEDAVQLLVVRRNDGALESGAERAFELVEARLPAYLVALVTDSRGSRDSLRSRAFSRLTVHAVKHADHRRGTMAATVGSSQARSHAG